MLITAIHTGKAIDGGCKAILTASPDVKTGELADLRAFFLEKGLQALPGYNEAHVLRVRGLENDAQLRNLLKEYGAIHPHLVDANIAFVPLDQQKQKGAPLQAGQLVRQHATGLVGLTSLVSGMAFLGKDLLHRRGTQKLSIARTKANLSASAAGFFIAASGVLTYFGFSAAHKPSATELIESFEPLMRNGVDAIDMTDRRSTVQRIYDYAFNNPWRIATLFNALGTTVKTTGHAIPSEHRLRNPFTLKKRVSYQTDRLELASSVSSFTALGFIGTAAPQDGNSLLGIPSYETSRMADDALGRHYRPFISPLDPANDHGNNGHTNMKVAGYLGMASNIGFGAKGALDVVAGYRAGDAKAWKSWPLLLVLPFNLAADYLTTISTPRFVYSLDDVATETAALINQKMKERPQDGTNATHQIYVLSELLAKHPRITQNSHQLREAIAGRLRIDYGYDLPNEGDGVKEYLHLSEVSPFAGPKKLDTEQVENTGSFLEKLKTERLAPPTVVARR